MICIGHNQHAVLPAPSDGQNQIAIRFNRDLNRNEDSIQTLRDPIQVPCFLCGPPP